MPWTREGLKLECERDAARAHDGAHFHDDHISFWRSLVLELERAPAIAAPTPHPGAHA